MINLQTKIQYLKGVGPKMGAKLNKLGIETVADLLFYWPRAYEDYTQITKIADLGNSKFKTLNPNKANQASEASSYSIRARIVGIANKKTSKRRLTITEAVVEDGTGSLKVVWFNQPFLAKMLKPGCELILNGKVTYNFYSHDLVMESPNRANRPKIVPIYAETAGISSYFIARQITNIKSQIANIKEYLPKHLLERDKWLNIQEAILNIHMPKDSEMLERARERIAFDELFVISLRAQLSKVEVEQKFAPEIKIDEKLLKDFTKSLPFELTEDQKIASWIIIKDLSKDKPMNRLLNGDVGSGKTIVAAFAAYVAISAGYRVAFMAPTEILAGQHFKTCCDILSKFGITVGLITSSQKLKTQVNNELRIMNKGSDNKIHNSSFIIHNSISNEPSSADLVIGTHALLQDKVDLQNVGLVVVDEQHRFGVKQRAALLRFQNSNLKSQNYNLKTKKPTTYKLNPTTLEKVPHFLSMTATPIPRTFYLALFADLDLSVIKTMPVGRKTIKTRVVDEVNRDKAYQFIREQIEAGRQAFVICPLIEDKITNRPTTPRLRGAGKSQITNKSQNSNSKLSSHPEQGEGSQPDSSVVNSFRMTERELFDVDRKSVVAEYDKLSKQIFPDLKIGMLHGRMKSKEKEEVMGDFKAKTINILVSTSVVEVGVDVPNASIMMIEDAERFGLAQLHQFRGRVGRADHQSFCFLFSNSQSELAKRRLQAMEQTNDGFKLAELDLNNRGAGDIFGVMQSGDINLKMASLSDRVMIEKASSAAKEIVGDINKYPALMEKVKEFESGRHLE